MTSTTAIDLDKLTADDVEGHIVAFRTFLTENMRRLPQTPETLTKLKDPVFLKSFLYARKFDYERTIKLLINYFDFRTQHAELIKKVGSEAVRPLVETGAITLLPGLDRLGRRMSTLTPRKLDFSKFTYETMLLYNLFVMEKFMMDPHVIEQGFVVVENFEGFGFWKAIALRKHLDAKMQKVMFQMLQDVYPLRLKGIYLVNEPFFVRFLLGIVRPFMKKKLMDRVRLFGPTPAAFTKLHELIDPKELPEEYGGTLVGNANDWLVS